MFWNKNKQRGGDNSHNNQAAIINYNGLSYEDAKKLALDVYNSNIIALKEEARRVAEERAEVIAEKIISSFVHDDEKLLDTLREPAIQMAIFNVEKEYVKNADDNTADILVNLLTERAKISQRNILQLVLDESLSVVGKITYEQMDILSLIFNISESKFSDAVSLNDIETFFNEKVKLFVDNISYNKINISHLQYANCLTSNIIHKPFMDTIIANYRDCFSDGFTWDELVFFTKTSEYNKTMKIKTLVPINGDENKYQFRYSDEKALESYAEIFQVNSDVIKALHTSRLMSNDNIEIQIRSYGSYIDKLFDLWNFFGGFNLTPVGIAIAQANISRKINEKIDLSIWVN